MLLLARLGPLRNALLLRGLGVWMFARLSAAFLQIPDPSLLQELLILGAVAAAVLLDARRRSEDLFLGNLGIPPTAIVAWSLPLALIAELLVP